MRDHTMVLTSFFVAAVMFLYLPALLEGEHEPPRPDTATASVQIIKPINDVAAVALIKDMHPHKMPTIAGDAEITRGSEIWFKVPDSLRAQMNIDPRSQYAERCIEITPDDYGWRVVQVYTRYECKDLHYD